MAVVHTNERRVQAHDYPVRAIYLHDLRIALGQGWQDFLAKRGDLIFLGLAYPVVVVLAAALVMNASILPLVFPLVAGSVIFGPVIASGYYELARRRELGQDSRWRHFFDVLRGPVAIPLAGLTGMTVLVFALWVVAAWFIYGPTVGALVPEGFASAQQFLRTVFATPQGWTMIVVGNVVGLAFAILALAISMVSFPMVVDKRVEPAVAVRTSIRVVRKNPVTSAIWGLIIVALSLVGAAFALVGLAVVFPVLGYATWHLYTRAVVR
ncbi:DUF2189 domain-containing protein [Croceicoccus ponticola]|uniref:DUF2189 domain-containing protein n=1 Tax=Croceicoccus ponticola TaxID=2217664 RepID=A0A437GXN0_9SPHN|nr:DUF2189 domain-containing protein [Croceicoccus ponticola]RVQ67163.1 DUF2189 domain-containing protein [Croceicoccus ponticola]